MTGSLPHGFLDELRWRGLLFQHTERAAAALDAGRVTAYCGFDPSASSLHVGSLVPIMALVHLQRAGHHPIALLGGGTGLIGDPSGKATERPLLDEAQVDANVAGLRGQLERFLDFTGPRAAKLLDNGAWLRSLKLVEFLRDTGKHFTVNWMMQKDSVKARMESGISYTEFTYMLLQAYDFLELSRREGVTLQIGGSDQWGNITAGTELVRRMGVGEAHGVTVPLVTTAAGTKFGKTEAGAVWLDAARTSPYEFYQFWVNADDADIPRWLRYFTLMTEADVAALEAALSADPSARTAQKALAAEVTTRVHGAGALAAAEQVTGFFFGGVEPSALTDDALAILAREAPFAEVTPADVGELGTDGAPATGERLDVYRMLTATGLAASNGAARKLLEQGGVSVNKRKLAPSERYLDRAGVTLRGGHLVIGKGKRDFALIRLSS